MIKEDFLVEILTEELPPKILIKLATTFCRELKEQLKKSDLAFGEAKFFATPRRLALLIKDLAASEVDQVVERKGPAHSAAFDAKGKPSKACIGFAKANNVTPDELITIKTPQGEWVGVRQKVTGKSVFELLPVMIDKILTSLPVPKRMRWHEGDIQFIRPVHSVLMLYGDQVVDGLILGCRTGRTTLGHRFLSRGVITIPHASAYETILATEGRVIADFAKRRDKIQEETAHCIANQEAKVVFNEDLLDEVTGLVEWPSALCGQFDPAFLNLPAEVLVSAMENHQRYFPMVDRQYHLLPYFVVISNLQSTDKARITHGNERVLKARLADAQFFYALDQKESLQQRIQKLKGITFQDKLGTLYEKAERISALAGLIAKQTGVNEKHALHAGLLAKCDLTTLMVNEFPELQGVMGYYYALSNHEPEEIANAILEHYLPRFSGDALPQSGISQALAVADRIDTLVGIFGINQMPTSDKDPYALRRAAISILRILIEKKINLDLKELVQFAFKQYQSLENPNTISTVLNFLQERLRAWYQDQGIAADVYASVAALSLTNPFDVNERIKAVQSFKEMQEAEALSIAVKRVSNILAKYEDTIMAKKIDPSFFENSVEKELAHCLEEKSPKIHELYSSRKYEEVLLQLSELRKPIDNFFDKVMVMTDDKSRRENRVLLLMKLRSLFLQVADIALLQ